MSREWKPGDVAMWRGERVFRILDYTNNDEPEWHSIDSGQAYPASSDDLRPLVVIDPEDRDQVDRLARLVSPRVTPGEVVIDALQSALREFADPKPKPLLDRLTEHAPDGLIDPALAEQVVKEWLADNAEAMQS